MNSGYLGISLLLSFLIITVSSGKSKSSPDAAVMRTLKASLVIPRSLNWSDPDPCQWTGVICSENNVVIRIQIARNNLKGSLSPDLKKLSSLALLDVSNNQLTGPIPSLAWLSSLEQVNFQNNSFSYMPPDFFTGLTSLATVVLDNNPFASWEIPDSLKDGLPLEYFSANEANVSGTIPDLFWADKFPFLVHLHLAANNLQGKIPSSFDKSSIQTLWLNGQSSDTKLNGSIAVIQNMTALTQLQLQDNLFTGPLPDFSRLSNLENLSLNDNILTGIVPLSLINLPELTSIKLTNNLLQGPTPRFNNSKVDVDLRIGSSSFCLDDPGVACDSRVNILLSIAESMGYPVVFAESWKGNDPCDTSQTWMGISCDVEGNITTINFQNLGLLGTISSNFSMLSSLKYLIISNNSLHGTIPNELTTLSSLETLDISNNHILGRVPNFRENVIVITDGNPDIERDHSPQRTPPIDDGGGSKNSNTGKMLGSVIGVVCGFLIVGLGVCLYIRNRKFPKTIPIQVYSHTIRGLCDVHSVDFGNMVIPIQVLRNVTNNFSEENKLGRGGFGAVYKGKLNDGTEIAVKRMESRVANEQGITQFESEIAVLTKVRHKHLVTFLGYCLDGDERVIVYEYMPQGTLSRHLFNWEDEGLKPLEWNRRLNIALDVARGVEYLHGLAQQSFIHRDLKPSNILLGDGMRAKVSDFGLVRLVPESGKHSIMTRVAGTFGYLAPEYVVTGRITPKVDVYSFGVILMELITGRKAVNATHSDPENFIHLVTWFRKMPINHDTSETAIDKTIELNKETLASISTVAELADHCCASEPCQRPDMRHVVNVLSSLAESWKPVNPDSDVRHGIGGDTTFASSHSSTPESLSPFAMTKLWHRSVSV